jgi:hypothetical protein
VTVSCLVLWCCFDLSPCMGRLGGRQFVGRSKHGTG